MTINTITANSLRVASARIEAALGPLAKEMGLSITAGNSSYSPTQATLRLTIKVLTTASGKSGEQVEFERLADLFDLQPSDYGRTFTFKGLPHTLFGFKARARTHPVLGRSQDGTAYAFTVASVKYGLAKA